MIKSKTSFHALLAAILGMNVGAMPMPSGLATRPTRGKRISKKSSAGLYGRGLRAAWDRQREQAQRAKHPQALRDQDGAYTLTGSRDPITGQRRKWAAGISAQR